MPTSRFLLGLFHARRRVAAALGAGALLLGAAACGGSSGDPAAGPAQEQQSADGQPGRGGQGDRGLPGAQSLPGAAGEVVAVTGSTAQVQSQRDGQVTGQTAVSWTGSTTFTQQVSAKLTDIAVGACVMVRSADVSGSSTDTGAVAAGTVRIVSPSGEDCSMGGLDDNRPGQGSGRGGETPSPQEGAPEGMPSGGPSRMPPGGTGGRPGGGFGGAFGKVTAVSSAGFAVESTPPGASGADSETSTVEVTVGSDTTYTKQADAEAGDVKAGVCLQARGESDSVGAIAATTVSLSQPVDGSCGGFGMGGFPGGRGPGGAPGASDGDAGQES